ncbi:MAG: polysulfide reductase NrfD [Alphaproteobacteria bacterium]|nr:polysulfide reductase NrfD [Alphaproteobacteria bacterium]
MKTVAYREVEAMTTGWWMLMGVLAAFTSLGLLAAFYMEHNGHWVTGMTNQIVWGLPHVFAVFLIVAASGALNVASISSVFGRTAYKPLAPLSALLAVSLLAGGLTVLLLDLGRPDRLMVAMTKYNFRSIFAWNVILYSGFFGIVVVYMWTMMDRRMKSFSKPAGFAAFAWRLILTTGTGSIFGFLVARTPYDSAVMAPMFIAMSFSFGLAVFILVVFASSEMTNRPLGDALVRRLKNLLGVFIAAVLYFVTVQQLTGLYVAEKRDAVVFLLTNGGVFTILFWLVQIGLGALLPLALLFAPPTAMNRPAIGLAAILVILGGIAQVYVIIIGGQAYPMPLFPGFEATSSFFDGQVNTYVPSGPEAFLGVSGFAVAMLLVAFASTVFRFLPESLADEVVDPHCAAKARK